ncbi:MAG: hypothetical protein ACTSVA_03890 [Candidatus Njordarchaeales archaeon]
MRKIVMVFVLLIILGIFVAPNQIILRGQEEIRIIFRNSLGQYYSTNRYTLLINDLSSQGVIVGSYNASEALPSLDELLQYDVLVIPNPGDEDFSSEELDLIKQFVDAGKGLIVLGDVAYGGNTYGKPDYLNKLLEYLGIRDKVEFWGTNAKGDELYDNSINVAGRGWQVIVSSKYFKPHIISVGIEKVVITSTLLIVKDPAVIVATTPETSYAADADGNIHAKGLLPWLAAIDTGKGKIVVCGSSRMFSDRPLSGLGSAYIQYEDNEKLFFNFIWWLTGKKLKAPVRIQVFIPIMDIFGLLAGAVTAYAFRMNMRKIFGFSFISGLFFALIAALQTALFGATIVGVAWPGWGYVSSGLTAQFTIFGIAGEYKIPAWQVAATRYFLTGILEIFFGTFLFWLILEIDEYFDLGIAKRIHYSKE